MPDARVAGDDCRSSLAGASENSARQSESGLVHEVALGLSVNEMAVAVMMVSPHSLAYFALGFLFSEGIINSPDEIREIHQPREVTTEQAEPVMDMLAMDITLSPRAHFRYRKQGVQRKRLAGCGICGSASLATAFPSLTVLPPEPLPELSVLGNLHQRLTAWQQQAACSGGQHAAALLDNQGHCLTLQTDIGRHNALDKVIGFALQQGTPLAGCSVLMSSRCSVELVQKAIRSGLTTLIHLSSPSQQAVKLAATSHVNLVQQLRSGEFIVHAC